MLSLNCSVTRREDSEYEIVATVQTLVSYRMKKVIAACIATLSLHACLEVLHVLKGIIVGVGYIFQSLPTIIKYSDIA